MWRAYEVFEQQGSSRALSRRVLEQQRPRYQAARTALGARTRLQEALNPAALPLPPGRPLPHLLTLDWACLYMCTGMRLPAS